MPACIAAPAQPSTPVDEEFRILAAMARSAFDQEALDLIAEIMAEEGISRTELARRMRVSAQYVSQQMNGERGTTFGFVIKALCALGLRPRLDVVAL